MKQLEGNEKEQISLYLSLSLTHTRTHTHTHTHTHVHTTFQKKKGEQDPLREGSEHLSEQPTQPRFDDLIRDMNKAIDELGGEVRSWLFLVGGVHALSVCHALGDGLLLV